MQDQPGSIALLISTYNWPEALRLVMTSLLSQTVMPDEVVIADDGSGSETKKLIDHFRDRLKITVHHVRHEDKGFRKTLILNKAVQHLTSAYIVQIDGDMIMHPFFIADHLKAAKDGYFVQGSRTMITEKYSTFLLSSENMSLSAFGPGLSNRFNALRIPLLSPLFNLLPANPFHVKSCNMAFKKADYIRVNGYDNRFEGWGGEDYEFAARLLHAGLKRITLKMSAVAYHIYHPSSSTHNAAANDCLYKKTRAFKLDVTDDGYAQADKKP